MRPSSSDCKKVDILPIC
jgi:hypothetical protein